MGIKELIVELSDKLLTFLLDYKSTHPGFRFWMRSREHNQAGDQERLSKGQWFQGSDYIFLSFHSASGHVNMTRSIGWVIEFDEQLAPRTSISVVWPKESDEKKVNLYRDIIEQLGGFNRISDTKFHKPLPEQGVFESLTNFLAVYYPQINELIGQHGLTAVFEIPEEKFQKQLSKVFMHREALKAQGNTQKANTLRPENKKSIMPLNQILYGPPGTGKTYHSIARAVSFANPSFDISGATRAAIKAEYDRLRAEQQIEFITFHQSLGYEDFIEGIKPLEPKDESQPVQYRVQDGIFKKLCLKAGEKNDSFNFDASYESFINDLLEAEDIFVLKTPKQKKPFTVRVNSNHNLVVKPQTETATEMVVTREMIKDYLLEGKIRDWKPYTVALSEHLKGQYPFTIESADNSQKAFVLIIDEINRGNVSPIFGELITLIEEDKRRGRDEELSVTLPYSKTTFSVPANLHIIGTMNTADRSVEALDTALRRRFEFAEITAQPELLSPYHLLHRLWYKHWLAEPGTKKWLAWEEDEKKLIELTGLTYDKAKYKALSDKFEKAGMENVWLKADPKELFSGIVSFEKGISLTELLVAINKRLNALLSKDHIIGHAWLMNVFSLDDLRLVFKNKILPLLQEFFYNDYAKIGLVLGDAFVKQRKVERKLFASFTNENELAGEYEDKVIYTLANPSDLKPNDFAAIYQ